MNNIGKAVRYHRKKAGLSQLELAQHAGVGKTVVYDVEKGKNSVRFCTLLKIFKVLNITFKLDGPFMAELAEEKYEKG